MNYIQLNRQDVNAGFGVRVSLYCTGCRIHCPGCHNPQAQDFNAGKQFTDITLNELISALVPKYISGLTICGGEPMEPENQVVLRKICAAVKAHFPKKDIWCYTGYELEDLLKGGKQHAEDTDELLSLLDVLIVGPFVQAKRDVTRNNLWRGSTNQRVLDVPKSLEAGKPVPLDNIPNNLI